MSHWHWIDRLKADIASGLTRNNTTKIRSGFSKAWLHTSCLVSLPVLAVSSTSAFAQTSDGLSFDLKGLLPNFGGNSTDLVTTAVFLGATIFALLSALALIRERGKLLNENNYLKTELTEVLASNEQSNALVNVDDQRIVLWRDASSTPLILGELPAATGVPVDRSLFLGFGRWLQPESAGALDAAIDRLRRRAEGFDLNLQTFAGANIEAQGRTSGGSAFVRFLDLTGDRAVLASLEKEHQQLSGTLETMQCLLQSMKSPAWLRDANGQISWANEAYIEAVEAASVDDVVAKSLELLETADLLRARKALDADEIFQDRLSAIVSGSKIRLDVIETKTANGFAGLAFDVSETENALAKTQMLEKTHAQTLDQMDAGVAIFDSKKQLTFHNSAFQSLWGLDTDFLSQQPDHSTLLDHLRGERKLPETPDWKKWKEDFLVVYQSIDPSEDLMHLPDGRTLHIVATPHRAGGVTWIFNDVTGKLELEGRFDRLTKIQSESFENLVEGVAVFGSDGRLQLSNSAFGNMWQLDEEERAAGVHVAQLAEACGAKSNDTQHWLNFVAAITGLKDKRDSSHNRMVLSNGLSYDFAVVPLPDGQTMLTFVNVTDSVNVETALTDRNEALQTAEVLKNAFVENMSYELRTLLTNIKGFTEVLISGAVGELNEQQNDYMGHVQGSAIRLESIVDSMLDLASIDAGILELDVRNLELQPVVADLSEQLEKHLAEKNVTLSADFASGFDSLDADPKRLPQILFNLVSNAIKFSPESGSVRISGYFENGNSVIAVEDEGPGIPEDFIEAAFSRFEGRNTGGARKGAGLGLALVKSLMQLHGGDVHIAADARDHGTKIVCVFPKSEAPISEAAE